MKFTPHNFILPLTYVNENNKICISYYDITRNADSGSMFNLNLLYEGEGIYYSSLDNDIIPEHIKKIL